MLVSMVFMSFTFVAMRFEMSVWRVTEVWRDCDTDVVLTFPVLSLPETSDWPFCWAFCAEVSLPVPSATLRGRVLSATLWVLDDTTSFCAFISLYKLRIDSVSSSFGLFSNFVSGETACISVELADFIFLFASDKYLILATSSVSASACCLSSNAE